MSHEEAMRAVFSLRMSPELLTVVAAALSASRAMAPQALPIDIIASVACVMIGVEDLAPSDVAANLRTVADRLEGKS